MIYSVKHKFTFHEALFQVSSYVAINSFEGIHTCASVFMVMRCVHMCGVM